MTKLLSILSLLFFCTFSGSSQSKKEQIEVLSNNLDSINNSNKNLQLKIDSLNTSLSTTRVNALEETKELNTNIEGLNKEINVLKVNVTELEKTNVRIMRENEKLKTDLGQLTQQNLALEAKFKAIKAEKNSFKTIKIGDQEWMVENLNVVKFRNGDDITQSKSLEDWRENNKISKATWCYNGFVEGNDILYNWHAVNDSRGIAPIGYRVSTDKDWGNLATMINSDYPNFMKYLNEKNWDMVDLYRETGYEIAMSLASVNGWLSEGGSNSSGFSALPVGYLRPDEGFTYDKGGTIFWSKDGSSIWIGHDGGFSFGLNNHDYHKSSGEGYSIRCIIEE